MRDSRQCCRSNIIRIRRNSRLGLSPFTKDFPNINSLTRRIDSTPPHNRFHSSIRLPSSHPQNRPFHADLTGRLGAMLTLFQEVFHTVTRWVHRFYDPTRLQKSERADPACMKSYCGNSSQDDHPVFILQTERTLFWLWGRATNG